MTKQELNRDIKRLWNLHISLNSLEPEQYYKEVEERVKPEFKRLYGVDREFKYLNKQSIIILMSINLTHRFVELHSFGLMAVVNNN